MKTAACIFLIFTTYLHPLNTRNPQDILGKWVTPENQAIVQIDNEKGEYSGRILRINPLAYNDNVVPKDYKNADPALQSRSLEGLTTLSGITYDKSKNRWKVERMYDPERGKYFEGYIIVANKDELHVRGHVPGKKWLGKTEVWRRIEGSSPF